MSTHSRFSIWGVLIELPFSYLEKGNFLGRLCGMYANWLTQRNLFLMKILEDLLHNFHCWSWYTTLSQTSYSLKRPRTYFWRSGRSVSYLLCGNTRLWMRKNAQKKALAFYINNNEADPDRKICNSRDVTLYLKKCYYFIEYGRDCRSLRKKMLFSHVARLTFVNVY